MNNLNLFVENGKKIIGIAANYKSLLKVLNREVPSAPEIFIKPTTSYITEKNPIVVARDNSVYAGGARTAKYKCSAKKYFKKIPTGFSVNQEVELGVIIGKRAKRVNKYKAMDYVGGYCVALDMTATCKIKEARSKGGSWTLAKGFDTSTPVSKFISKSSIPDPYNLTLWCSVNGQKRQNGLTNDLVFDISDLISYISTYITLEPNDLILTGSPPDMGPVKHGDVVETGIKDIVQMKFKVIDE